MGVNNKKNEVYSSFCLENNNQKIYIVSGVQRSFLTYMRMKNYRAILINL